MHDTASAAERLSRLAELAALMEESDEFVVFSWTENAGLMQFACVSCGMGDRKGEVEALAAHAVSRYLELDADGRTV